MLRLSAVSATPATAGAYLDAISDLEIVDVGGARYLCAVSRGVGGLSAFALAGGAAPELRCESGLGATGSGEIGLEMIETPHGPQLILFGDAYLGSRAFALGTGGMLASAGSWSDPTASVGHGAALAATDGQTAAVVFVGRSDGHGLRAFGVAEAGGQVGLQELALAPETQTGRITALQSIADGSGTWLLATDGAAGRITLYGVAADGTIASADAVGAAEGLGIAEPGAIASCRIGGQTYALVAASGTGSLTVLRIGADGQLTVADHVIDDLATRFAGACHVETVEVGGRVLAFVAGSDDGVSAFTLLPDGRLVHLATFQDSDGTTLANVSALTAAVFGAEVQLHVASGTEAGLTTFRFDLAALGMTLTGGETANALTGGALDDVLCGGGGADSLTGGAGADILHDGFGRDSLAGGTGADLFVLSADNTTDVILDYNPREDRLDLSAYPMLYSVEALDIETTAWGAVLRFGTETVEVRSAAGTSLGLRDFSTSSILSLSRVPGMSLVSTPTHEGTEAAELIRGGDQNEIFVMKGGRDRAEGEGGADVMNGGAGFDTLLGGLGNDSLYGGAHADRLLGGDGNDFLSGEAGADTMYGEVGEDVLHGGSENDRLWGGVGRDTLRGGTHDDLLQGGDDNDTLFGEEGFDRLDGGLGDDRLYGGAQADNLYGGDGHDVMYGGDGLDRLFGGAGNDTLDGGAGGGGLFGDAGDDVITGGADADRVYGGSGNDTISTGSGNDTIYAGGGFEVITAGAGNDLIWGHANADTFIFADGFGQDRIEDFEALNAGEKIDLREVSAIVDLTDLMANHIAQVGADVVITAGAAATITLVGVTLGDLDASDFLF